MAFGMIATWEMSEAGVDRGLTRLRAGGDYKTALKVAIGDVEDNPDFHSVGYGGLPNAQGIVALDAAFMNGDTYQIGAIAGAENIQNPFQVAMSLSTKEFNNFLVGKGAQDYALTNGFKLTNMLTAFAKNAWLTQKEEVKNEGISPYAGHDTVGIIALDSENRMGVGTSTSGLFMKEPGRVGDSPLPGAGYYVDSKIGGAAATGMGEDLMKGNLSFEIVRLMGIGHNPQAAADIALNAFLVRMEQRHQATRECSLIAMDAKGNFGAATNTPFKFIAGNHHEPEVLFEAYPMVNGKTRIIKIRDFIVR